MRRLPVLIVCLLALGSAWSPLLGNDMVSYFRHDSGLAADDGVALPDRFDRSDQLLWRQPLPAGHSTPCLVGDLIVLTTGRDDVLVTVALDRETGSVRWKRVAPNTRAESYHRVGGPATSTPASDGRRIYSFFGSYGLLCYDLQGNLLWSKPMGPFQDEFGCGSSPILVDGKVIVIQDHDIGSFLMAIDQQTGKTVWKVEREGFTRSYATPTLWEADGKKQLLVPGALQLIAYDVADGSKLWWVDGLARIVNTTLAKADGLLYVATWSPGGDPGQRVSMDPWAVAAKKWDKNGDAKLTREELPEGPVLLRFFRIDLDQDGGLDESEWSKHARVFELAQNAILAIRPGGRGNLTDTHVEWQYQRGIPYVPSPLVYRGVVYLVKNGGILTSLDAVTGNVFKQARLRAKDNYYASPVAGDGKIYIASEGGGVSVVKAEGQWDVLAYHDFGERIVATPVLEGGRIYLRTDEALYCFGSP